MSARGAVAVLLAGALAVAAGAAPAAAQERLIGARVISGGPYFELWNLDDVVQPPVAGEPATVSRVTQLSVPIAAIVPVSSRFTLDLSGGFATGTVKLANAGGDASYSLSGPTDTKLRLTGRLANENLVLTLGANLPSGPTKLDDEEFAAARVLAAPALGLRMPVIGNGTAFTAGIVGARSMGGVALALGASYEVRTSYSPLGIVAGLAALDYDPSDAVRVSLMADGLVGRGQMRAGVTVDAFTEGVISTDVGAGTSESTLQLGPVVTAEWHWQLPVTRLRAFGLSVVDRYRSRYQREGSTVDGSAANYLTVAAQGAYPLAPRTDLVFGIDGRHQTGLDSDDTIAAAAFAGGGLSLGVARQLRSGLVVQPLVRAQAGRIESAGVSSSATGFGIGLTATRRF